MEKQKITTAIEVALAALGAGFYLQGMLYLSRVWSWEARINSINLLLSVSALGVLLVIFFWINKTSRHHVFVSEVVEEFSRVTWPGKIEVRGATIYVSVFIILAGVFWGLIDWFINQGIAWLIKV